MERPARQIRKLSSPPSRAARRRIGDVDSVVRQSKPQQQPTRDIEQERPDQAGLKATQRTHSLSTPSVIVEETSNSSADTSTPISDSTAKKKAPQVQQILGDTPSSRLVTVDSEISQLTRRGPNATEIPHQYPLSHRFMARTSMPETSTRITNLQGYDALGGAPGLPGSQRIEKRPAETNKIPPEVISLIDDSNDNEEELQKLSSTYRAYINLDPAPSRDHGHAANRFARSLETSLIPPSLANEPVIIDLRKNTTPSIMPLASLDSNSLRQLGVGRVAPTTQSRRSSVGSDPSEMESSSTSITSPGPSLNSQLLMQLEKAAQGILSAVRRGSSGLTAIPNIPLPSLSAHTRTPSNPAPKNDSPSPAPRERSTQNTVGDGVTPIDGHSGGQRTRDLSCPVCMEEMTTMFTTKCGHVFCGGCIFKSVVASKKCAICRGQVRQSQVHQIFL